MRLTIDVVNNGYILKSGEHTQVFEEREEMEHSCLKPAISLLYAILDELGIYGNKHTGHKPFLRCTCELEEDCKCL